MRRLRALVSILALVVALATDPAKADLNHLERLTVHQSSHVFDHGYIRSVSADRNPLARFHDRLLGRPLTHNLILRGGDGDSLAVPTGSRLGDLRNGGPFHGYVDVPDGGQPLPLWKSHGDWVQFIPTDGNWIMLDWREIDGFLIGSVPGGG